MRIPSVYKVVIRYITPLYLLTIFVMFLLNSIFGWNFKFGEEASFAVTGRMKDLVGDEPNFVARLSVAFIVIITVFALIFVVTSRFGFCM